MDCHVQVGCSLRGAECHHVDCPPSHDAPVVRSGPTYDNIFKINAAGLMAVGCTFVPRLLVFFLLLLWHPYGLHFGGPRPVDEPVSFAWIAKTSATRSITSWSTTRAPSGSR
jgi:hypothetical protein